MHSHGMTILLAYSFYLGLRRLSHNVFDTIEVPVIHFPPNPTSPWMDENEYLFLLPKFTVITSPVLESNCETEKETSRSFSGISSMLETRVGHVQLQELFLFYFYRWGLDIFEFCWHSVVDSILGFW